MSSPHATQAPNIQPQPKGRRTRSLRSCLACRKAKQRCELPDSPACIPSKEPQPANLVCRRCNVMRFDCVVSDPLPESVTSGKAASRKRKRTQQDSPAVGQRQQAPHHSSGSQSHSSIASSSVSLYNGSGPSPPTSNAPLDATSSSSSRPDCSRTPDERSPEYERGSGALSYRSIGHSSSILHPLTSFERSCSDRSSTKHGEVRERECRSAGLDLTGNVPLDNVSGAPPYKRRPLPNAVPAARPASSHSALSMMTSNTDPQTSRPPQRLIHELQVFDPSPSFGIRQLDANVRASDEVSQRRAGSDQASREPEWMQRLKVVMLPFLLLDKLCSVQCDKLTLVDGDLATPPDENLDPSVGSSDIEPFLALLDRMSIGGQQVAELDERLEDLVATLPWLPSISTLLSAARRFEEKVLNLLVACLYFAAGKAKWLHFKAALLPWLRRGCLGCLLQAPQGPEDVAFLLYVALYEPLLLNSASGARSLDGKGFLASASAAARNLGLDRAPARLAAALHELPPGADLGSLATVQQEAVLWVSLSLHAVTRSMAETIDREPMARCTEEDCEAVVHLADRLGQNRSPQATWRAIGLYLLAEHAKLAEHGRQLDRTSCKALSRKFKTSDEFHLEAEKVAEDYDTYRIKVAERMAIFWRRCRALGFEDESVVDWVNIEFIFLMLLCMCRLSEAVFDVCRHFCDISESGTFMAALMKDGPLVRAAVITTGRRADMTRHALVCLSNFHQQHFASRIGKTYARGRSLATSISPIYICAMLVQAAKQLAEEVAGHYLDRRRTSRSAGETYLVAQSALLLRSTTQALLDFGGIAGKTEAERSELIRMGNLFGISANCVEKTARVIHEWGATARGLRQSLQISEPTNGEDVAPTGMMSDGPRGPSLLRGDKRRSATTNELASEHSARGQDTAGEPALPPPNGPFGNSIDFLGGPEEDLDAFIRQLLDEPLDFFTWVPQP